MWRNEDAARLTSVTVLIVIANLDGDQLCGGRINGSHDSVQKMALLRNSILTLQ